MNAKRLTYHFIFSALILFFSVLFFSNSINAQDEFSVRNVDHFGGYAATSAVSGDYAFLCQGTVLTVLEISDIGFSKMASLTLPEEPSECCIHNNYLYFFQWRNGIRIIDILDPSNPNLVASLSVREGDNWGQGKIFAAGNSLYVALEDSIKIVDISNPVTPTITNTILTSANDIFVRDKLAFICDNNKFKIFDLTDLQNTTEIGSSNISRSRCVFVQGNFAYVGIEEYPDNGLQIFDISNPENPTKLGHFATKKVEGNTTFFENPQQIVIDGSYAYIGCRAQGATLYIADVSDSTNPVEAGKLEFDEGRFPSFESLHLQYPYLYAATGASSVGFIKINISDPAFPEIEHRYEEPWDPQAMATCGDTLYVSSMERLWVYDYSDTSNPVLLGSDTTWAELSKMQVENNYLYGTNENSFHILDVNDPNNIFEVGNYSSKNENIIELVVYENYAYLLTVSETQSLLEIVNISNPNLPVKETAEHVVPGNGRDFCLLPDSMFALVAYSVDETNQGFQIINISDLSDLIVMGSAQTTGNPMAIGVTDTLAIVGSNTNVNWYLEAFSIVDPANPVNIGSTAGNGLSHQSSTNFYVSSVNNRFHGLNQSGTNLESLSNEKHSNPLQNSLTNIPTIFDFTIVPRSNLAFKDRLLLAVSIPNGSLHFFFLQPGAGTVEWVLQAICHSPASTVIAAIMRPYFATFFSIDGWFDLTTKQVSGSWGIFVQRLLLKAYLTEIAITPPDSTVEKGSKVQFKVKGKDNFGNDMDIKVTWSASGGEINSETGEYTATEEGEHTVTAVDNKTNMSQSTTITVKKREVASVTITPSEATVSQGEQIQFEATGYDSTGEEITVNIKWKASGGWIDSSDGLYTASEVGDFTISATDSNTNISGSATVHVNETGVSTTKILPTQFNLLQNYPNPFNPTTTIEFSVKEKCFVLLEIFDIRGRVISTLISREQPSGSYRVNFDARDFPSGVYFYKIKMKNFTDVKKMVVLE